ncbi:hypothetical protein [Solimonas flava]|uniref:hypothetical protein n=1 Tax=Solimonas flava TaxID=415849 RepID=UPI000402A407|nr:hypothetical protein [Solimonas flava]
MTATLRGWFTAMVLAATLAAAALPSGARATVAGDMPDTAAGADAPVAAAVAVSAAPLALGRVGSAPWPFAPAWFALGALLVPAALWLVLAWKQAFETDPVRGRRRGVRELHRLLRELQRAPGTRPTPRQLHRWLLAAARAWDLRSAAPSADELAAAIRVLGGDDTLAGQWQGLWRATERGLYAADAGLADNWAERAQALGAALLVPPRTRRGPDRRVDWLPPLAVLTLALWLGAPEAARAGSAAPATASAVAADAAESLAMRDAALVALQAQPRDWAAHENLAHFYLQQQDGDRALAHATAAFLLHSSTPQARDTLRAALALAPGADSRLQRLFLGNALERLPAALAPGGWQRAALLASLLFAAAAAVPIVGRYRGWPRRYRYAGIGAAGVALLALAASIGAWQAYGELRLGNAGLLLQRVNLSPTPTDLVPQDETTPAAGGSVVLGLRAFLGWRQVAAGSQVGWVRAGAVMPLYGEAAPPPAAPARP